MILVAWATALLLSAQAAPAEREIAIHDHTASYYSSIPLDKRNADATQAVIMVHGSERRANDYFGIATSAAASSCKPGSVVVVAPHFKIEGDQLKTRELYFEPEGWLSGDQAVNDPNTSSFEVIDALITQLANGSLFPKLQEIVIAGHSAGGQLTQKYAVGSRIQDLAPWIRFRYVISSPGSYLYLNPKRLVPGVQPRTYAVPDRAACPTYNSFKYGLENRNRYFSQDDESTQVSRYLRRDVVYLVGSDDRDQQHDPGFDHYCEAELQGPHRLARTLNFKGFLDQEYPGHSHELFTLPFIGHSQWDIFSSAEGKHALFSNCSGISK